MSLRGPVAMFLAWARGLRFPWLVAITASVFVVDLLVPDFIPFADEVLLGLLMTVFASWRKRRTPFDGTKE